MTDKITIPQPHIEFCQAVARLCRDYKMNNCDLSYDPELLHDPWPSKIHMRWQQGRHGEESDRMSIHSDVTVQTRLGPGKGGL